MKLNLRKTKELVIRGRTPLPPPETIVTIKRVSFFNVLGVTFQDSRTNWDKHFDDLMERALKRMHIFRACIRNGYSVRVRTKKALLGPTNAVAQVKIEIEVCV